MGRIKQGLDYFPLNTDFMHDRIVRRVMKREGDSAFTILLYTLSHLYSGEGYYLPADDDFCDELSDQLFTTDNDCVRRVLHLYVEYGFFDSALYKRYGILTSADIQRQYLFVTKRRSNRHILPNYCLIAEETEPSSSPDAVAELPDNVCAMPENVTQAPDAATKTAYIKRKEKERKENILPNPPCQGGDEEGGEGGGFSLNNPEAAPNAKSIPGPVVKKKGEWTQADVDRMQAPADGCPRNLSGLLDNLRLYRIPPAEQYAIVLKSNYGEIGGKVWQGFGVIRASGGKIKLPGHYLLSVLNKRDIAS
ncbi:DUF4373 domain-containing protein [uncultured Bacteroides sp.]|uniref:DUF4373 domain-containing protein n=1 Tax=uncultured Bacteroides sp. TaxID=162156 RepID=UPI0025F176B1|nr:DUF4373 domain-containing protein [uncultured Bacteroides sp.]